ncbi:hypothetical protein [Serratia fonticola]|jgi:hypothetical protein|uniref:MrpH family fimbial adhesin n=1 Tax=Serratia fonticola TaxID=47917 RepID=UPI00217B1C53|nr:hypothetical protein [Serratia fonticola]CAI0858310.1 Uncharacterised protein [Serratia fonticola]CAI2446129.1 Uncharacterised protein [Serratia fonticola]
MNISTSRFLLLPIIFLFFLYPSDGYSIAFISGGKLDWVNNGGFVSITSNTITFENRGNTNLCPYECSISIFASGDSGTDIAAIIVPGNTTIPIINAYMKMLINNNKLRAANNLCVYFISATTPNKYEEQEYPETCKNNPGAGMKPSKPPTPPLSCSIDNGTINHGQVKSTDVANHKSSTTIMVNCSGEANVSVKASSYSDSSGISLNGPGTLKAQIYIDGVRADISRTIYVNTSNSVTLSSVLKGDSAGVTAGSYIGSVVLVTSII